MREILFTLVIKLNDGTVCRVTTYTDGYDNRGAQKYRLEVKHAGKVLFAPEGEHAVLWGAHSPMWTSDGKDAKRASLTHLGMKPGDTDSEFFEGYTPDQLDFVTTYGEEICMIAYSRYGEG